MRLLLLSLLLTTSTAFADNIAIDGDSECGVISDSELIDVMKRAVVRADHTPITNSAMTPYLQAELHCWLDDNRIGRERAVYTINVDWVLQTREYDGVEYLARFGIKNAEVRLDFFGEMRLELDEKLDAAIHKKL